MDLTDLKSIFTNFKILQQNLDGLKKIRKTRQKQKGYNTYDKKWYNDQARWYVNQIRIARKFLYIRLERCGMEFSEKMSKNIDAFLSNGDEIVLETEVIRENAGGARQ